MDVCFYNIISSKDIYVIVHVYKDKQHNLIILFSKIYKYKKIGNTKIYRQTKLHIKIKALNDDLDNLFFNLEKEKNTIK